MTILLLVASAVLCLSGVLALVFGIPYKEFSVGNTMIVSGVILLCSGFVLVGLAVVAGELRKVANLLDPRGVKEGPRQGSAPRRGGAPAGSPPGGFPGYPTIADDGTPSGAGAQPAQPSETAQTAIAPRPFTPEPVPEPRLSFDAAWPNPAGSNTPQRQNPSDAPGSVPVPPGRPTTSSPPAPPQQPRRSDLFRRSARASSLTEHPPSDDGERQKPPAVEKPATPPAEVSVLKSGVVDGMAYTLYSDGSIEAELAEGKVRFASIEALRSHLDQRGG